MSLAKRLEALQKSSAENIPEEKRAIMGRAIEDLRNSGILERVPRAGSTAPDFRLSSSAGAEVSLSETFAKGPLVVSFYRGHW